MRISSSFPRLQPVATRNGISAPAFMPTGGREGVRASGQASTAGPTSLIGSLFQIDAEDASMARRSRGIRHAEDMLGDLEQLQGAILSGRIDKSDLAAMAAKLNSSETPDDPRLAAIHADIQLRVAVELAKLTR
jgi:Class II flagellar assembly regulator